MLAARAFAATKARYFTLISTKCGSMVFPPTPSHNSGLALADHRSNAVSIPVSAHSRRDAGRRHSVLLHW